MAVATAVETGEIGAADKGQVETRISAGNSRADEIDQITRGWDEIPPEFIREERSEFSSVYLSEKPPKPTYAP